MSNPLLEPIARTGEPIYASIVRNRSGMDSGCIDYGCRVIEIGELSDGDKQDIADTAYALYESVCRASGKVAALAETGEAPSRRLIASEKTFPYVHGQGDAGVLIISVGVPLDVMDNKLTVEVYADSGEGDTSEDP